MTLSPWVQNAQSNRLPAKALVDGFAAVVEAPACGYCGYTTDEGAVLRTVEDGVTVLCTGCSQDVVLGACGHSRVCDCSAG